MAKKPASAGFFMDITRVSHHAALNSWSFSAFPESPHHIVVKIW
ncbi:hypothetical protein HMPREF0880_01589 [Yokenella regensburgei ATCC 43003]|nr:hypothetical protein HMPREF0880_01589 [Yokenella regensburgei ATCC 43003]